VEGKTTKVLSDYRPVNGVMLPFEEKKPAGSEMLTVLYTHRTLRQDLDTTAFAIPFRKDYQMPPSGSVSVPAEGGLIFQATIDGRKCLGDASFLSLLSDAVLPRQHLHAILFHRAYQLLDDEEQVTLHQANRDS